MERKEDVSGRTLSVAVAAVRKRNQLRPDRITRIAAHPNGGINLRALPWSRSLVHRYGARIRRGLHRLTRRGRQKV